MSVLSLWIYILIIISAILFGVFAYLCFLWTNRGAANRQNIMAGIQVSVLHTFKVFLYCTLIFALIYLLIAFYV